MCMCIYMDECSYVYKYICLYLYGCINIYVYTLFLKKIFNLIFSFFPFVELFVVHRKKYI
jgi:hypothetical protein